MARLPDGEMPENASAHFNALLRRTWLILLWERLWPVLAVVLTFAAAVLALAWFGVFVIVPPLWRLALDIALVVAGSVCCLIALYRLKRPSQQEALARLDQTNLTQHRPASAWMDRLAGEQAGPGAVALWNLHRARLGARVAALEAPRPVSALPRLDPFALRVLALLALVMSAFIAADERQMRLAAAFDWQTPQPNAFSRIDLWIEPPIYTHRVPIVIDVDGSGQLQHIEVVRQSKIVIRHSGDAKIALSASASLEQIAPGPLEANVNLASQTSSENSFVLKDNGELTIKRNGQLVGHYQFDALPDHAPVIEWRDKPQANFRGSLSLSYGVRDDYGINLIYALVEHPQLDGQAISGRSLVKAPQVSLPVPSMVNGAGDLQTVIDVSKHPWAGAEVDLTLVAENAAGQTGRSETVRLTLPEHPFKKHLPRALVEQRRNLILASDDRARVAVSLAALMLGADVLGMPASEYLGLRVAANRLDAAKDDDDLIDLAEFLWQMAIQLEEGSRAKAEAALKNAQKRLEEALRENTSPEEMQKRMDELHQSLAEFMRQVPFSSTQGAKDASSLPSAELQDLDEMLAQIQRAIEAGNMKEVQRLLRELQDSLENLDTAEMTGEERDDQNKAQQLEALLRGLQQLRDDTFSPDSNQSDKNLQERQQQFNDQLEEMLKKPGGTDPDDLKSLEEAQRHMKDALNALSGEPTDRPGAADDQGKALDDLSRVLRNGQKKQKTAQRRKQMRSSPYPGNHPSGLLNQDPSPAQQARKIQEELRRRLSRPDLTKQERDYYERLLENR